MTYNFPHSDGGRADPALFFQAKSESTSNKMRELTDLNAIKGKQAAKQCPDGVCKILWKPLRNSD